MACFRLAQPGLPPDVEVSMELQPIPLLTCEPGPMNQVFMNLLTNAIRYTETGEVRFEVEYRSEVARFTIIDTGPGIPADQIPRIFLPFERLTRPRGPVVPGTGLGLTITKLLTEIQGGELAGPLTELIVVARQHQHSAAVTESRHALAKMPAERLSRVEAVEDIA